MRRKATSAPPAAPPPVLRGGHQHAASANVRTQHGDPPRRVEKVHRHHRTPAGQVHLASATHPARAGRRVSGMYHPTVPLARRATSSLPVGAELPEAWSSGRVVPRSGWPSRGRSGSRRRRPRCSGANRSQRISGAMRRRVRKPEHRAESERPCVPREVVLWTSSGPTNQSRSGGGGGGGGGERQDGLATLTSGTIGGSARWNLDSSASKFARRVSRAEAETRTAVHSPARRCAHVEG
jgi:hypothetical protein